ncbi:hypothetical protein [Aquella oligotrophica]|uniref:Choice-of-anchor D domain-containing protein n=1 Tax=Aquella oligotrophica TaxID=2067065 RepID=A0A2I7N842_9NEIS|nr:hypothetical protein [Aquella oligotrophica]AUR52627.1 hypothetical protein CUN60_10070 [Aquella oligotrophica]
MYKKLNRLFIGGVVIAATLNACGGSSGSATTTGGGGGNTPLVNSAPQVKISQMSTMPVNAASGAKYYVGVYNDTPTVIDLQSIATTNAQNSRDNLSGVVTALYNGAGCSKLQPSQSCTIAITPTLSGKEIGGGFLLTTAFTGADGKSYNASQVLQYGKLNSVNGITVANNNMRVVTAITDKSYIAVPYLLGEKVSVKPSSSVTPLAENNICDGKYCTHFYTYHGGDFTSKINFTNTILHSVKNLTHKSSSLKDAGLAGFTINSNTNSISNVITDGYNTTLIAGQVAVPVVLKNSGLADATINSIISTTDDITVDQGSCMNGSAIAQGNICLFHLTTSAATNGSGTVTINYDNNQTISLNVIYLAATAKPGLQISTNSSDLSGTIYGETKEMLVTIKNSSTDNTKLHNLKIGRDANPRVVLSTNGVDHPCDTSGNSTNLDKGAECNFKVTYTPLAGGEGGTFNLAATAQYSEASGHMVNLVSHAPVTYSSVAQSAHLNISDADYDFGVMRADGHAELTHTFIITNDGQALATGVTAATLSAQTPALSPSLAIIQDNCNGNDIAPTASCTVTVKFGAATDKVDPTIQQLSIGYNLRAGSTLGTAMVFTDIHYAATKAALINDPIITSSVDEPIGGLTKEIDPVTGHITYNFYPTLGASGKLKFTLSYTNSGTEDAENFVIAANTLPIGFEVNNSSTCPTNPNAASTLAIGSSCDLIVEYINDTYLSTFGTLNANFVMPGYSYKDASTGVNQKAAKVNGDQINALSWGTVNAQATNVSNKVVTLTFTLNASNIPATIANGGVTISMPKLIGNGLTATNNASCSLATFTNGATCTITVTAEEWIPTGGYAYEYYAVPTNGAATSLPFRAVANFTIN